MKGGRFILLAVMAFSLGACREPSAVEEFIPSPDGPWIWSLDMRDSTRVYDVTFYTRVDARPAALEKVTALPMDIHWISPSGALSGETVYLPLEDTVTSTFYSRQVRHLYRSGLVPAEPGMWTLVATVPDSARVHGLRGMGVRFHHEQRGDGTR